MQYSRGPPGRAEINLTDSWRLKEKPSLPVRGPLAEINLTDFWRLKENRTLNQGLQRHYAEINLTDSWRLKGIVAILATIHHRCRNQPYRLLEVESSERPLKLLKPRCRNQPYRLLEVESPTMLSNAPPTPAEINLTDSWRLKVITVVPPFAAPSRNQPYRLLEVERTKPLGYA